MRNEETLGLAQPMGRSRWISRGSQNCLGLEIPTGLYPKTKQKASLTEAQRGIKVMFALITHRTINTLTGLGMK